MATMGKLTDSDHDASHEAMRAGTRAAQALS